MSERILEEALRITSGDRQRDYDHPLPNHERIAALWNPYLAMRKGGMSAPITAEDVGRMMILLKIGRDVFTPKRDNLTDIAGYADCIDRMRQRIEEEVAVPSVPAKPEDVNYSC